VLTASQLTRLSAHVKTGDAAAEPPETRAGPES
jgi:hypothetical protein